MGEAIKDRYYIREISTKSAEEIVIEHHYLHRKASCSYAYGLFDSYNNELVGVIMYRCPTSRTLQKGICGTPEADNVIELTRLWVDDRIGKNSESFLISNTMKLVPKDIIVSFAEIGVGHVGYVYQATNWIYTGITFKRSQWQLKGKSLHSRSVSRNHTLEEIKQLYKDDFYYQERPQKHRYVYFNCDKRRKKYLKTKLRYKIFPYPKLGEEFHKTVVIRKSMD